MPRIARLVVPGLPHHVTQRGNRRETVFFHDDDHRLYRDLLAEHAARAGTEVWSWCLMPNHVHLILVPSDPDGLRAALAGVHRRYTAHINARHRWTGHLWQARFGSVVMDEAHLHAAARYVALNPVRAGLVRHAAEWPWSSARAHLARRDDGLCRVAPLLDRVGDFSAFLGEATDGEADAWQRLRRAERTGRPAGADDWIAALERRCGRILRPRKRGPKPRGGGGGESGDLFGHPAP